MLKNYPKLKQVVEVLDNYLAQKHPEYFSKKATRPFSRLKPYKIIHDPLWGTNRYSWRELAVIDSPLVQRLRRIHQTGLAYYVYPSARHSRFEHSLGVATVASRILDAVWERQYKLLFTIANEIGGSNSEESQILTTIGELRQELRLAALLHDVGHSLFSHASEKVYSQIPLLKEAAEQLSDFAGKEKGAGEVLSFCVAHTQALHRLLARAKTKVSTQDETEDLDWNVNYENISLLVIGRARHPYLQFMGDIISCGFDADKLDYLRRDAESAGLPLRYDLERYLQTVEVKKDVDVDHEGSLKKLYARTAKGLLPNKPAGDIEFSYYDTYRLRLPKRASSTVEQIVICKIMLYSYIYHHQKVRAAEGILEKLLAAVVAHWRRDGRDDREILLKFIDFDDSALCGPEFLGSVFPDVATASYRLSNRVLPREVYRLSPAMSHVEGKLLRKFFLKLKERDRKKQVISELEEATGRELLKINSKLGKSWNEALWTAGVWFDAPKPPGN